MSYGKFCEIFGINPRNRILEFFLETKGLDYGIGDVSLETGLNRATTYNTMAELIKNKYVTPTRVLSGAQLYNLNTKKKEVKILLNSFKEVLKIILNEYGKKITVR
jgi:DNA-binding IclR family transcriptional regulator